MDTNDPAKRISAHLDVLCNRVGNRHVGSPGNVAATAYVRDELSACGLDVRYPELACMDWEAGDVTLGRGEASFEAHPGPYSLPSDVEASLVAASTIGELDAAACEGCILLLHGELAREPLFPKNFVFYNPEEHRRIYALIESKRPAAVVAATGRCPGTAGAVYPFPMFEDGDFDVPNAYMKDVDGERLRAHAGERARLAFESRRIPATAHNVIATGGAASGAASGARIVLTAHVDAKKGTPGALDDATGVATLLAVAELLRERPAAAPVEIAVLNGEDYYAASGQMAYVAANEGRWGDVRLAVNLDVAGYREGGTAYSFYECPDETVAAWVRTLSPRPGIAPGQQWYQGDHSIFVQQGVPAVAFASDRLMELSSEVTHTEADVVDLVDVRKLADLAEAIATYLGHPA